MAAPINLNRRRKQRERQRDRKRADANRAWHGATRTERERIAKDRDKLARKLDGARRDRSPDDDNA